ncbi:MAG: DUF3566 domain-containing protein [Nocardioides sp.]
MTDRPAEQTRPAPGLDQQQPARPPLAERLQQKISAAARERRDAAAAPADVAPAGSVATDPSRKPVIPPPAPGQQQDQTATRPAVQAPARARRTSGRQAQRSRPARRARLRLTRIDPWSVMKVSFLLSIAFGIVTLVAVMMVWSVLGAAGVWTSINQTVADMVSSGNNTSTFNVQDYLGTSRVMGFTMLVSVIDVVLVTAIATLAAFLYNMAAALLGGIEVTLAEDSH